MHAHNDISVIFRMEDGQFRTAASAAEGFCTEYAEEPVVELGNPRDIHDPNEYTSSGTTF